MMKYGGFCVHCQCARCEESSKCELYHPSMEDYCQYDCQGSEMSISTCQQFKEKITRVYPSYETEFQDIKQLPSY